MELAARDGVAIRFYKALRFLLYSRPLKIAVTWDVEEILGQLVSRKLSFIKSCVCPNLDSLVSRAILNSRTLFVDSVE